MNAFVTLPRITLQNANAVSGLTWGFPGVSPFLGFCHALDRKLCLGTNFKTVLGGCAIVCHDHQVQSVADEYGEHIFSLTRNPLTKEGRTAPFNEEGRMHLSVTLIVEWCVDIDDYFDECFKDDDVVDERQWIAEHITQLIWGMRIAGGSIISHDKVSVFELPHDESLRERGIKRALFSCLPGFALVDRSELLIQQYKQLEENGKKSSLLESWMDFGGLRFRADKDNSEEEAKWAHVPLPDGGWLVPLVVGYQGIHPTQPAGSVESARDSSVPFTAVESVYGVGQWLSPHGVKSLEPLFWRYRFEGPQQYLFENNFSESLPTQMEGS